MPKRKREDRRDIIVTTSSEGKPVLGSKATELLEAAWSARERSYSPFSRFAVGAAAASGSGLIYTGANIENSSLGLTVCAERVAVFAAIAAGEREITALAVVAECAEPLLPCGACLQVLAEFAPRRQGANGLTIRFPDVLQLFLSQAKGEMTTTNLATLLPQPFVFRP